MLNSNLKKLKFIAAFLMGCVTTNLVNNAIFFYNTNHFATPIQETKIDFSKDHVVFMYQKNRTDESFYKMLSYSDNIIFIGDQKWKCLTTPCLELEKEYDYKSLDIKLIDTITQLTNKFPNSKTFAKLDDDALVHPNLYHSLTKSFTYNNYAGILREYVVDNVKMKFLFMEGHFYMLSRDMAECFLKNSFVNKENMAEDVFLGKVLSNYCRPKYLNLRETGLIWHRNYNIGKNKNCNLEQQYSNDTN